MKRFTKCLGLGMTMAAMLACAAWSAAEPMEATVAVPQEIPLPSEVVVPAAPVPDALPATAAVHTAVAVELPPAVEPASRESNTETLRIERGETQVGANVAPSSTNANLISLQLDKTSLEEVVKLFQRVSGANIIVAATNIAGHVVTANLTDVEWRPALISILNQFNLDLIEKSPGSSIYSIGQKQAGAAEPMLSEHFPLSFTTVSNVIPVVTSILGPNVGAPGGGSVVGFPAGNSLVVRGTASQLQEVRTVIKAIDTQRKQVYIETKFVELSDQAIKDLGINWSSLQGYTLAAKGMTSTLNDNRTRTKTQANTLADSDARNNVDTVNQAFDKSGAQIETVPGSARTVSDTINRGRTVNATASDTINNTFTDFRTAVLSASDFAVMLSALQQQNGISVVSNPKLIVANEANANIHIGKNQPNIRSTVTAGQQGQANTVTYALDGTTPYFKFGITLDVTPTINTDTNITVRIKPTLSRFIDNITTGDGSKYPITTETTLDTVFALGAERTAVIGGLTETDTRDNEVKIPLLGDIPIIGKYLFSWNHKSKTQTETIIFVTVGIANPAVMLPTIGLPREAELIMDHFKMRGLSTNRVPLLDVTSPPEPPTAKK
ncbi:MAG: secretin N-terminal domain-containing protein [bacterium]